MASFTDLNEVVNRITGGNSGSPEHIFFSKVDSVGGAAAGTAGQGKWVSLFAYDGSPSGADMTASGTNTQTGLSGYVSIPGSPTVPDNTTTGGLKQTDPGGGRQKWLLGMTAVASTAGVLVLYDRLLHISGLTGAPVSSPTAQNVGGTLTRYTNSTTCIGNQIWVEIYSQIGATARTITASYTNQAGTPGKTTTPVAIGLTPNNQPQRIIPLPLAVGDSGVQAVASVTLSGSTGTAGNFGVTIARPLCAIPIAGIGVGAVKDLVTGVPSLTEILPDACLSLAFLESTATNPSVFGSIHMCER